MNVFQFSEVCAPYHCSLSVSTVLTESLLPLSLFLLAGMPFSAVRRKKLYQFCVKSLFCWDKIEIYTKWWVHFSLPEVCYMDDCWRHPDIQILLCLNTFALQDSVGMIFSVFFPPFHKLSRCRTANEKHHTSVKYGSLFLSNYSFIKCYLYFISIFF